MRRIILLALSAATVAALLTAGPAQAEQKPPQPAPFVELVSPGGVGRLYTADPRELDAATAAGYRRQPGTTGFIDRAASAGSTPLFRLKPSATASRWLFTASTQERDVLIKQGWINEGTAGYVATQPGAGLVQLRRFTNGSEWRLALEPRTTELLSAGYKLDGPVGYVHQTWIRAGAVYFGMFHTGGHPTIIARTKAIYGRDNDWWGGVRDFHDGTHYATDNWPGEDWSNLKPSIGYYDDSQPATLEKHITQATSAGLSFFNFYYYWDSKKQRQDLTDQAPRSLPAGAQQGQHRLHRRRLRAPLRAAQHPGRAVRRRRDQPGALSAAGQHAADQRRSQDPEHLRRPRTRRR